MTWYNSSWNYRKAVTVSNSGSTLTDYQISVTIDTASLVTAIKMRSDCGDIRFTDTDGSTLLSYWIESGANTSSTKIWVKIPSILTGIKTIYLYYGNSSATTTNDGNNTFLQFHGVSTTDYLDSTIVPSSNVAYEAKVRPTSASHDLYIGLARGTTTPWSNAAIFIESISSTNLRYIITYNTAMGYNANETPSFTNNIYVKLKLILSGSVYRGYVDDNEISSGTSTQLPTNNMGLYFRQQVGTGEIEYAFARKYAVTEPTTCIGGEEVLTPSWLTNWNRRKLITITGSTSSSQTDYQMKITVHKSTGTDTSTDIYAGTNINNDFSDLRFTTSDGSTLLNYWIESYTSGSVATLWIKIPSIPTSPCTTSIYAYYDNSGASSVSSGINTFIEFLSFESGLESFSGGSRDTVQAYDGSYSFQGAIGAYARRANITITRPFIKEYSYYVPSGQSGDFVDINVCVPTDNRAAWVNFGYPTSEKWGYYNASTFINSGVGITYDTWHTLRFMVGVSSIDIYTDNTVIFAGSTLISPSPYAGNDNIYRYSGKTFYIDAIRSHKYVSPEPTFSTIGSEETLATPANITATNMTITPSETPCREGICTVTIDVTWTNTGGTSGSFTPSIKIDTVSLVVDPPLSPVIVGPLGTISQQFVISGLTTGTHNICPDPN